MNIENLKLEIRQIESQHKSPVAASFAVFQFIRGVLVQVDGPVEPEFKRTLRLELDRAHERVRVSVRKRRG